MNRRGFLGVIATSAAATAILPSNALAGLKEEAGWEWQEFSFTARFPWKDVEAALETPALWKKHCQRVQEVADAGFEEIMRGRFVEMRNRRVWNSGRHGTDEYIIDFRAELRYGWPVRKDAV